jgi:hypothetical protein
MDKKKIFFIVGIILIVILGIITINISKKSTKPEPVDKLNESILKDTTVEGVKIANQSVVTRDGLSTYMANLINDSNETKHLDDFYIIFTLDGEEIRALAVRDIDIAPGKTYPISIVFDRDISKSSKVEYLNKKD